MGFSLGQFGPDAWTDRRSRAYRIHMPHDTQVIAACEDVGCDSWRFGWETVADESDPAQATVAMVIRSGQSGRTFREMSDVREGVLLAVFRFDSGQRCFAEHRTRPGRLLVYSGGRGVREHTSLRFLAEDYTEHMGGVAAQQERG